jgi:hypothetical protein
VSDGVSRWFVVLHRQHFPSSLATLMFMSCPNGDGRAARSESGVVSQAWERLTCESGGELERRSSSSSQPVLLANVDQSSAKK